MAVIARLLAMMVILALVPARAYGQESAPSQVAWRLLDYVAVDYSEAVSKGQIVNAAEYAEMQEFSASVRQRLADLPQTPSQPDLLRQADELVVAIAAKAEVEDVAKRARGLADDLITAYPTPLAPQAPPDLKRGETLYADLCADCHGVRGDGRGPSAEGLDPPPIAFRDLDRARQRSIFGLYQVIGQGLEGTDMESFAHLPSEDRWALALYSGGFAFGGAAIPEGERLWRRDSRFRARLSNLQALMQATPADLAAEFGESDATLVTAYLRHNPAVLQQQGPASLDIARQKLAESLAAYRAGDAKHAEELALAAYLDGFEPVEPVLASRNGRLLTEIEGAMAALRVSLTSRAPPAEVEAKASDLTRKLDLAEQALAPDQASPVSSFLGAFTILLREGLEALLIVVAMLAFLRKADRRDALPYVHAGWVSALAAGGLTWAASVYVISISGASRELTEGFGSLLAALVLVSVGIWMHGKAQADAWQRYIKERVSAALSKGSAWFLFLLAFLVVYREVFETILFYAALWSQGAQLALLSGAVAAVVALALIAWGLLVYSRRLPISRFFAYSSLLIAALSVVLAGKGVAALQEAGLIGVHPIASFPRIDVIGVYPTWESVLSQVATLAALVIGFWLAGKPAPARPS